MSQKLFILSFTALIAFSCTKDDSNNSKINSTNDPIVFILAGQSNALGSIKLTGLEDLKNGIPLGEEELTEEELLKARLAVANSIGRGCFVDEACVINPENCANNIPYSHQTADIVIAGLRSSDVDWRSITDTYTHPTAKIKPFNYKNTPVIIQNENGVILDNSECQLSAANTTLVGPELSEKIQDFGIFPLGTGYGSKNGDSYGPELSFAMEIGKTIPNIIVVKVSMGGSNLNDDWRSTGTLYQTLITETKNALEETSAKLGGLIWFQGFNDKFKGAYCQELAPLYEENLRRLLTDVRKDLDAPTMPVVIVDTKGDGETSTIIRNAQETVANEDENALIVPSGDLSKCFHYDSGSQIIIGERAAKAMKQLLF